MFEALLSILKAGKALAFVGAGAWAPMYPLWGSADTREHEVFSNMV